MGVEHVISAALLGVQRALIVAGVYCCQVLHVAEPCDSALLLLGILNMLLADADAANAADAGRFLLAFEWNCQFCGAIVRD